MFVHISALDRSGLTRLSEGQPVVVDLVEGRKVRLIQSRFKNTEIGEGVPFA